jgi:hypothetical protein
MLADETRPTTAKKANVRTYKNILLKRDKIWVNKQFHIFMGWNMFCTSERKDSLPSFFGTFGSVGFRN